ncbi:hypothetical protein EDB83DRAFT_2212617 [Lactarius deliciosus]|nr:hypothetical protein EDB83DRAFT_2212617 [Lactarius deliciosus]
MPGLKLTLTLAAAAYAIGKYTFRGKDPPPRDSYLTSTLAAATHAINKYFFSCKAPPRDSYLASTLAAVTHAIDKYVFLKKDPPRDSYLATVFTTARAYFFCEKEPPPPRYSYLASTLAVSCTVVTAYAISTYLFSGKDDNPPHDSYYSSSSYIKTQQSYKPTPQSPSYTDRPPPTYSHSQTVPRTSAPSDDSRNVRHTRTPSQTHLSSIPSDALAVVEDLDFAKKLREKARRSGQEMAEAYSQANSAQRIGDCWGAQEYRQQGDAHKSVMEELDERAARIIFRENNKDRKNGEKIDLHGLFVAEAVGFVNQLLQYGESRGDQVMCFIVGKGLHSDAGRARIRPALEDLCTERGLGHSLDPHNAGVLIVRLNRQR